MADPVKRGIVVAVVLAVAAVVVAVVLVAGHNGPVDSVADLDTSDCVDAPGYLSGTPETPTEPPRSLERVDCDDDHDAEVLVTFDLSDPESADWRATAPNPVCVDHLDDTGTTTVTDLSLLLVGATDHRTPGAGDAVACLAFKADGSQLDGHVGTR